MFVSPSWQDLKMCLDHYAVFEIHPKILWMTRRSPVKHSYVSSSFWIDKNITNITQNKTDFSHDRYTFLQQRYILRRSIGFAKDVLNETIRTECFWGIELRVGYRDTFFQRWNMPIQFSKSAALLVDLPLSNAATRDQYPVQIFFSFEFQPARHSTPYLSDVPSFSDQKLKFRQEIRKIQSNTDLVNGSSGS